jgi:GNAT superfamily N-acetyltransferase
MLRVREYDDGELFWREVAQPLSARPVLNNVFVGVANRARSNGSDKLIRIGVFEHEVLALGALRTPPHRLNLADLGEGERAVQTLAAHLARRSVQLPGVMGREALGESFSQHWMTSAGRRLGSRSHHGWRQNLYQVQEVVPPANVAGRMRKAQSDERALMIDWQLAFAVDADLPRLERGLDHVTAFVDDGLADGTFAIWDVDGRPASVARRRPIGDIGVRIGAVYTPPEMRGHGYAAALTAALSQAVLDEGRWCCLFADAANALTNRLYQRIGYAKVGSFADIVFADG